VRVYLPLDEVEGGGATVEREALEAIGEFELLDALLGRRPDRVERIAASEPSSSALTPLRRTLFRMGAAAEPHTAATPVHALAAPDMARELDEVARRVKRLIVTDGVAPHDIAIVSRKSRPYGPRAAEVLRRHGVPVSARLRSNLTEVSAVAALLHVFAAAAEGFSWRTLAELAESPYFALDLDVGLLKRASTRGRYRSLDGWSEALAAMLDAALHQRVYVTRWRRSLRSVRWRRRLWSRGRARSGSRSRCAAWDGTPPHRAKRSATASGASATTRAARRTASRTRWRSTLPDATRRR
jgi:ATP-dependent exoDNAse (exonuclease V) beta subunit